MRLSVEARTIVVPLPGSCHTRLENVGSPAHATASTRAMARKRNRTPRIYDKLRNARARTTGYTIPRGGQTIEGA